MKSYEITGYTHDGGYFCPTHKPSEDAQPVFASDEIPDHWSCDLCIINKLSKNPYAKLNDEKLYSVYVDGAEVNDYFLTFERATALADQFIAEGYDKVSIQSNFDCEPSCDEEGCAHG